jgi:hypothetical protein
MVFSPTPQRTLVQFRILLELCQAENQSFLVLIAAHRVKNNDVSALLEDFRTLNWFETFPELTLD